LSKRRKSKAQKELTILKYIAYFLSGITVVLIGVAAGYYFGFENAKTELEQKEKDKKERRLALLKKIEETNVPTVPSVQERLKEVLDKEKVKTPKKIEPKESTKKIETKTTDTQLAEFSKKLKEELQKEYTSATHEYATEDAKTPPERLKRDVKAITSNKPRLAIIIDDVSVRSQVKAIKDLNMNLTMSFLPPSKARPNSAKLASKENFYMVHLPMEAQSYSAEEPHTLRIKHTQQEISQRVRKIKELFPNVRYINNHTGSKYTADERAMNRLVLALNSNNISFVDSRTTSATQVPKVMKNFSLKYVARDVFLDHHMEKDYIKGQIKEAIRIAKNEGVAIAIGHPHKTTLSALRESRELLNAVDLVYINKVY